MTGSQKCLKWLPKAKLSSGSPVHCLFSSSEMWMSGSTASPLRSSQVRWLLSSSELLPATVLAAIKLQTHRGFYLLVVEREDTLSAWTTFAVRWKPLLGDLLIAPVRNLTGGVGSEKIQDPGDDYLTRDSDLHSYHTTKTQAPPESKADHLEGSQWFGCWNLSLCFKSV